MTLQDLIDHVGQPLFEQAQEWAWETAEGIGTRDLDGKPDISELSCSGRRRRGLLRGSDIR